MVVNKRIFLISFIFFLSACSSPPPTVPTATLVLEVPTRQPSLTLPSPTQARPTQTIEATPKPELFAGSYTGIVYRDVEGIKRILGNGDRDLLLNLEGVDALSVALSNDLTRARYYTDETGYRLFDFATGEIETLAPDDKYTVCGFDWWEARPEVILVALLPINDGGGNGCTGDFAIKAWQGPILDVISSSYSWQRTFEGSPDGRFVAFEDGELPKLYEWGQGVKLLNLDAYGFPKLESYHFTQAFWSKSGRWLAWPVIGDTLEETIQGIGVFDLETTTSKFLSPYYVVGNDGGSAYLQWSPDEGHLLLLNNGENYLRIINVKSEEVVHGSDDASSSLAGWSPNGDFLAYGENSKSTVIVSANGSILNKGPFFHGVIWSPDSVMLLGRKYSDSDDWPGKWYIFELTTGNLLQTDIPDGIQVLGWAAE